MSSNGNARELASGEHDRGGKELVAMTTQANRIAKNAKTDACHAIPLVARYDEQFVHQGDISNHALKRFTNIRSVSTAIFKHPERSTLKRGRQVDAEEGISRN